MKIALVHDYLSQDGGAEQVLRAMHAIWPDAPIHVLFFDERKMPGFKAMDVRTSFLQKAPLIFRKFQWYLPLMAPAVEHLDLRDYDVVVSSASAFAKGVITREDAVHVCYCHTPTRYLWSDTHSYVQELRVPRLVKALLPPLLSRLRQWDRLAAERVDAFVANSETVRRRIKKYYGRDSEVIHPPVDLSQFRVERGPKDYFLAGGRLVPYKRFDLVVDAATETGLPLVVFGSGPAEADLKARAGKTVRFAGRVSDEERARLFAGAKAFVNPQEEDFGITPIEAMASGTPVIAYRKGGATETVAEGVTGAFFDDQCWEEIADQMIRFDGSRYDPARIRAHAEQFRTEAFAEKLRAFVQSSAGV